MKPIEAELTKIAVNTFVTTKITYANMLADFCEKLPGANVDVVAAAIGADSRIGIKYLKGGVGFGGPCFPRDNVALKALGETLGVDVAVPREVHNSNVRRTDELAQWVASHALDRKVAILGLTYKIGSEVIEEAAGWNILQALRGHYLELFAYDPMFNGSLPPNVRRITDLRAGIIKADMVLVMLPYPEVVALEAGAWARTREQRTRVQGATNRMVIDCWRVLSKLTHQEGVNYIPIGIGD